MQRPVRVGDVVPVQYLSVLTHVSCLSAKITMFTGAHTLACTRTAVLASVYLVLPVIVHGLVSVSLHGVHGSAIMVAWSCHSSGQRWLS